jgi:magnesium transporter
LFVFLRLVDGAAGRFHSDWTVIDAFHKSGVFAVRAGRSGNPDGAAGDIAKLAEPFETLRQGLGQLLDGTRSISNGTSRRPGFYMPGVSRHSRQGPEATEPISLNGGPPGRPSRTVDVRFALSLARRGNRMWKWSDPLCMRGGIVLNVYRDSGRRFYENELKDLPEDIIWIDLLSPTVDEINLVEKRVGVRIPTIDALREIESSSRLSVDREIISLTAPVVAQGDGPDAFLSPIGFILTRSVLISVRFAELTAFNFVVERIRRDVELRSSAGVFIALMEAFVDRGADVLERLASDLDKVSRSLFRGDVSKRKHTVRSNKSLRRVLTSVGATGDRLALARDSLLGLGRIVQFVATLDRDWFEHGFKARLGAVAKDIGSLNEYEGQLSNKVQFLLDAVLGFITIEQNDLFKVLTIVSVVGIPPTVVAGIYGMNFKFMPELAWQWGYPFGLAMILLSAVLPLLWFKWRGWV